MTTSIVSPPMRRKAEVLAEQMALMSRGRSKETGQPFIVVSASNRMTAHWTAVDGTGCTCLGYQRRGICTRAIAAKIVHDRQATGRPEPSATDSAALLAKLQADQAAHTKRLRALGYTPDEYIENGVWAQRAEMIATLAARVSRAA
jgi:hypothetical protein